MARRSARSRDATLGLPGPEAATSDAAVEVPTVYHEALELAQAVLEAEKLGYSVAPTTHRGCEQLSDGMVLSQTPAAGRRVPVGTPVRLKVCRDADS